MYVTIPGWKTPMTGIKAKEEFPQAFKDYIKFLEQELQTPIVIVSVGPDRNQTIKL